MSLFWKININNDTRPTSSTETRIHSNQSPLHCPRAPSRSPPLLAIHSRPTPNSTFKLDTMNFLRKLLDFSKILSRRLGSMNHSSYPSNEPTRRIPCSSPKRSLVFSNTSSIFRDSSGRMGSGWLGVTPLPTLIHIGTEARWRTDHGFQFWPGSFWHWKLSTESFQLRGGWWYPWQWLEGESCPTCHPCPPRSRSPTSAHRSRNRPSGSWSDLSGSSNICTRGSTRALLSPQHPIRRILDEGLAKGRPHVRIYEATCGTRRGPNRRGWSQRRSMFGSFRDGRRNAVYPTVFSRTKQRATRIRAVQFGFEVWDWSYRDLVKSQYYFGQCVASASCFSRAFRFVFFFVLQSSWENHWSWTMTAFLASPITRAASSCIRSSRSVETITPLLRYRLISSRLRPTALLHGGDQGSDWSSGRNRHAVCPLLLCHRRISSLLCVRIWVETRYTLSWAAAWRYEREN